MTPADPTTTLHIPTLPSSGVIPFPRAGGRPCEGSDGANVSPTGSHPVVSTQLTRRPSYREAIATAAAWVTTTGAWKEGVLDGSSERVPSRIARSTTTATHTAKARNRSERLRDRPSSHRVSGTGPFDVRSWPTQGVT